MSAQRASAAERFARLAAAAVVIVLAAVIAARLAGRRPQPAPAPAVPPPEDRVVDLKERVRHQEYRDGRTVADIRGESLFRGPDGRNHLTGAVEVVNLGAAGETVSRLTADEVAYDPGSLRFTVSGRVRVEADGVVLEGESFDYDKPAGLFETKSGGAFSSKTMTGRASTIRYAKSAAEVRLGGGVRVELAASGPSGGRSVLEGESFLYRRRERSGRIDGRASVSGSGYRAEAGRLEFTATEDESGLESAGLDGVVRLVVGERAPGGAEGGEVRAEHARLAFGDVPGRVSTIAAEGRVFLTLRGRDRPTIVLRAPAANFEFDPDGRLTGWTASDGILAELAEGGQDSSRSLEGASAAYDAATGVLAVEGGPDRPAVADSGDARIEAAGFKAGPGSGALEASGRVLCLFKPGRGGRAAGLFAADKAVSVSADRLILRGGGAPAAFSGNARAWQGTDFVEAPELEFFEEKGGMRGRGGVSAGLEQDASGDAAGGRIVLGGEDLAYMPETRTLTLSGKAYVQLPAARLEAGTVAAVIGRDDHAVEALEAKSGVSVSKGRYKGRAEAASYRASTRRMALTGKPVLTDDKGGSARGAKLTFDLADDKIFIENEGPGRATTVVRS